MPDPKKPDVADALTGQEPPRQATPSGPDRLLSRPEQMPVEPPAVQAEDAKGRPARDPDQDRPRGANPLDLKEVKTAEPKKARRAAKPKGAEPPGVDPAVLDLEAEDTPEDAPQRWFRVRFKDARCDFHVPAGSRGEAWEKYRRHCGILETVNRPQIFDEGPVKSGEAAEIKESPR